MTTHTDTDPQDAPSSAELRDRKIRLEARIGEAFGRLHEREAELTREHALHVEEQGGLPEAAQQELDHLLRNWKALVVRNDQIDGEIVAAEERERLSAAMAARADLLRKIAEADSLGQELKDALDAMAATFMKLRQAQLEIRSIVPKRYTGKDVTIDSSWKERLGNQHTAHILKLGLHFRLGQFFPYENVPVFGGTDVHYEAQEVGRAALTFFDGVHGLYGLPGVPLPHQASDNDRDNEALIAGAPGLDKRPLRPTRMHGRYAGSRQVTDAEVAGPSGVRLDPNEARGWAEWSANERAQGQG